ncbi:hypothetical protein [Nostoc edaphicum]|uniref:hypothetical protein n=1 Tax=Nostoc edaphicum TaxID=264686 RepID=UPI001D152908|nr:hypothetical protein [Nostoc edaphicum]
MNEKLSAIAQLYLPIRVQGFEDKYIFLSTDSAVDVTHTYHLRNSVGVVRGRHRCFHK